MDKFVEIEDKQIYGCFYSDRNLYFVFIQTFSFSDGNSKLVHELHFMGTHFSSATLDDATLAMIKRKTRMKSSEITDWFNELKVNRVRTIEKYFFFKIH